MNPTSKSVAEYLVKATESMNGTKEFLIEPLPTFVLEYLKYEMIMAFLAFGVFTLLSIAGMSLSFYLAQKNMKYNKEIGETDYAEGFSPWFIGFISIVLAVLAPFPFLKGVEIVTTPKTFLLKEVETAKINSTLKTIDQEVKRNQ